MGQSFVIFNSQQNQQIIFYSRQGL